jgi:ABC-2 type transport system permease protein
MNKTVLIMRHEFRYMIRRKAFILMTLAFPLLALLAMGVYQLIDKMDRPSTAEEEPTIGYIDEVGGFDEYTSQAGVTLVPFATPAEASQAMIDGDINEYFVVSADYVSSGMVKRYTLEKELEAPGQTQWAIKSFLVGNLLQGKTSTEIAERVKTPMMLVTTRLTATGEVATDQGGYGPFVIPYIFSILLLLSIFFSSGYLLQGLGEEKENRIMEILLSSVSTRQLLAGKVIGLGAAGLIQMLVWLISAVLIVRLASTTIGGFIGSLQVPANFLILGVVYFILGYLLFAVLMAGVGAVSPTAREGQQMSTLFTLAGVSPLWFMPFILENPDHVISKILTIFPITAPVTVMVRLGLADVTAWELAVSIALLILAIIGALLLAAKIFRTFLLTYGQRPKLVEIVRILRNA